MPQTDAAPAATPPAAAADRPRDTLWWVARTSQLGVVALLSLAAVQWSGAATGATIEVVLRCILLATGVLALAAIEALLRRVAHYEALGIEARHDQLTGALARTPMMDVAREELSRAQRTSRPVGLLMIDVDHFKSVNDQHGHLMGDTVLAELVARIQGSLRTYDAVGRYGGDEFVVVLPDCGLEETTEVCDRLVKACRWPIERDGVRVEPTVSVGGAVDLDGSTQLDELLHTADALLYAAKEEGRDRWRVGTRREALMAS